MEPNFVVKTLRKLGCEKLAWASRRYFVPTPKKSLVLEVGAGGNPYPRANVLLDAYIETRERHWAPLVTDRPTVLGFVEELPFKDNSFDFVIAAHVLEHSANPEKFISELERVAKSGYIEVPDAFMERINPYKDHRLEIANFDGELVITKKDCWNPDKDLIQLYEHKVKPHLTGRLMPKRPFDFHVRLFWNDKIKFQITNNEIDASWPPPIGNAELTKLTLGGKIRVLIRKILRVLLSQNLRNSKLDISNILRCSVCNGDVKFAENKRALSCVDCNSIFRVENNLFKMMEGGNG